MIKAIHMGSNEKWILGIYVSDRVKKVNLIQPVLTKFGCSIKTRLGLHETEGDNCSPNGIMILELCGDPKEFVKLENALLMIEGLEVKKMVFLE
jgi:hypothetical protein